MCHSLQCKSWARHSTPYYLNFCKFYRFRIAELKWNYQVKLNAVHRYPIPLLGITAICENYTQIYCSNPLHLCSLAMFFHSFCFLFLFSVIYYLLLSSLLTVQLLLIIPEWGFVIRSSEEKMAYDSKWENNSRKQMKAITLLCY